jgi:hypothetical protein
MLDCLIIHIIFIPTYLGVLLFSWVLPKTVTQNLVDAEEQMGKSGVARRMHFLIQNTVNATCTEAEIVQESLWKHPPLIPHPLVSQPLVLVIIVFHPSQTIHSHMYPSPPLIPPLGLQAQE